jgi:hypothetical protein
LTHIDTAAPHGCWWWTGAVNPRTGYGTFKRGQHAVDTAHRWAYEYFIGPIPTHLQVQHRCSRHYPKGDITYRRCCNPTHLKLGTARENLTQAVAEGRRTVPIRTWKHGQ